MPPTSQPVTVLDVFDNFLGQADARQARQLSGQQKLALRTELRRFYRNWTLPPPRFDRVFPGSWPTFHLNTDVARTIIGNDLLLFGEVVTIDPVEPFVSPLAVWDPPPGTPKPASNELTLYMLHVPPQMSAEPPQLIAALYPPDVRVFMPVTEAFRLNEGSDWTAAAGDALDALEIWRPFIELGAVILAPMYQVSLWASQLIQEAADEHVESVQRILAQNNSSKPQTSLFTAGLEATGNWERPEEAARRTARLVAWNYSRETAVCAATGSAYAPDERIDRDLVGSLAQGTPLAHHLLSEVSASLRFPGIEAPAYHNIFEMRRDSDVYSTVRDKLRHMIISVPVDLSDASSEQVQVYLREHLQAEIDRLRESIDRNTPRIAGRAVAALVNIGLPLVGIAASVAPPTPPPQSLAPAVISGARALWGLWAMRRRASPEQKAMLWISRNIEGPMRRDRVFGD